MTTELIKKEKSSTGWIKIRNKKEEDRILAHFAGHDLFINLWRYSQKQMAIQWATQEDEIKRKKPWQFVPYTADDWADWKIIEDLREDEMI